MFVGNQSKYFSRLIHKRVGVELGIGAQGYFEGVGIMTVSAPELPNCLILLYPTFYAPNDPYCTVSNGALKKFAGFRSVLIDTHDHLDLTLQDGRQIAIPFITKDSIDFIQLHITVPTKKTRQKLSHRTMSLQPVSITNKKLPGTTLFSMWLHQVYGHRSLAVLQTMIDKKIITGPGLPCKLAPLPGRCPICDASRLTKIPRGSLSDTTELPVGTKFHIDFCFFNVVSIRGFTAALIIVEATSRYIWIFPSRSKRAPIDLCLYFFNQMKRLGLPVIRVRTDEDGALVNNTEFCKMIYNSLGMALESTGGYASNINGIAESPIRTIKRTTRANLMGSALPNEFWCFGAVHAAIIYNQCLHRMTNKVPSQVLTGKSIPLKSMHPFGARVKVVENVPAQRALTARTAGDPRTNTSYDASAVTIVESQQPSSFTGRFVGFSNHPGIILVFKPGSATESHRIVRVHHAIVDHYGLSISSNDTPIPHEQLLRAFHNNTFDPSLSSDWQINVGESTLDTIESSFNPADCETIQITLPPKGTSLGMYIDTDEDYLLPILVRVVKTSDIYDQIPDRHQYSKSWIIQVEDEQPITAQGLKDALYFLQRPTPRTISITFCKIEDAVRFPHQTFRAYFDSCTALKFSHMITVPTPPVANKSIFKCLDSPLGHEWEQALYHQYDKNDYVKLVAQPTPIENVPPDKKVLRTVISTKVKKKGDSLYQLVTRMCADGSKQEEGIDYEFSYSPTAGAAPIRITISIAASEDLTVAIIDVVNCFQSTLIPEDERVIISMPPLYRKWFTQKYPNVKWEHSPSGKYVLQLLNGLQGDKSIGRKWYLLLKKLLEKFGFVPCIQEQSLFIYEKDDDKMILNTSTDDFLCAYSNELIFESLCKHLEQYFDITTKTGMLLKYLNIRIIQSKHGISIDQSEHIQDHIINKYFPPAKIEDSHLKKVHTPFRTDNKYEIDLLEELPATPEQLKILEQKYGGTYASIIGAIMHVYVWTRLDLGYAITRLSQYIQNPSAAAFAGLYRVLRYIATHRHRPIMYPRKKMAGSHTVRVDFDHPNFESIELSNGLIELVDSDHARDNATRRSCHCILALLNEIVVHYKMQQQKIVALHSTDSEIRGALAATKEGLYLQDICSFLGLSNEFIRPLLIMEDSQPCIDALKANTVTNRVKHIAVPIHFIHQQIANGKVDFKKIGTHLNMADSGTKPNPAPTHFRQFDQAIGVRFYPPADSEHYKLLELDKFVVSPYTKDDN